MAHQWDRGVLAASSWHGLEEIGTFESAESAIEHGERSGAWPVALDVERLRTDAGFLAPVSAIVASYREHPARVVGVNGDRYRATTPDEWRDLVRAAVAAGATPTGAFSLRDGSRVLATFDVGDSNGLRTQLMLADSFDGSLKLTAGFTSVRVVCANTLSAAMREDGEGMARLRHTASLEERINVLRHGIAGCVESGRRVRDLFERASRVQLRADAAKSAFDALFPAASDDATQRAKTRAENERDDARHAAVLPVNRVGERGNLATLWNAATWLVDREADGSTRECRGGADRLDSLLFGSRAKRIAEIETVIERLIEVVRPDGTVEAITAQEAVGVLDASQILATMLD